MSTTDNIRQGREMFTAERIKEAEQRAVLKKVTDLDDTAEAFIMLAKNSSMTGMKVQVGKSFMSVQLLVIVACIDWFRWRASAWHSLEIFKAPSENHLIIGSIAWSSDTTVTAASSPLRNVLLKIVRTSEPLCLWRLIQTMTFCLPYYVVIIRCHVLITREIGGEDWCRQRMFCSTCSLFVG